MFPDLKTPEAVELIYNTRYSNILNKKVTIETLYELQNAVSILLDEELDALRLYHGLMTTWKHEECEVRVTFVDHSGKWLVSQSYDHNITKASE